MKDRMNWLTPTQLADVLESGKYPKTTGRLYRPAGSLEAPPGYCCLGVAACEAGLSQDQMKNQMLLFGLHDDGGILTEWDDDAEEFIFKTEYPEWLLYHESDLAEVNDASDMWAPVVAYLRNIETSDQAPAL